MSSRANRRRKRRSTPEDAPAPGRRTLLGRTERIAIGFLAFGIVIVAVVGLIVASTRGGDGTETVANTDTITAGPTGPTPTSGGSAADEADVRALAQRSIEVLPAGQWPSLYDDWTLEFRGRCDRTVFDQAGVDSAEALGASLQLLEYKELRELVINGDTASGIIIGRYSGVDGSDYDIQAAFAKEDGRWKLAPAPDTTGCSGFNQLN